MKTINITTEPCPHCGKTHQDHNHENGATICEDGFVVCEDYPYNVVKMNDNGEII